jgi:hypothetical protein
MNRYFMLRRLTGPMILLLLGVIALLHQMHMVHWGIFVPLLLILLGVMKLAERAALEADSSWQHPDAGQPPTINGVSGAGQGTVSSAQDSPQGGQL